MPVKKLKEFLDENSIKYVSIKHSIAYTAQEVAASSHIPGREMAKTVMIKVDGKMAMAVLPASLHVDFYLLRKSVGAEYVELATEEEFNSQFSDCELGAMPPFGNLYNMPVYVDNRLTDDEYIAFNAGTHTEIIRLSYIDYERIVKPIIIRFGSA